MARSARPRESSLKGKVVLHLVLIAIVALGVVLVLLDVEWMTKPLVTWTVFSVTPFAIVTVPVLGYLFSAYARAVAGAAAWMSERFWSQILLVLFFFIVVLGAVELFLGFSLLPVVHDWIVGTAAPAVTTGNATLPFTGGSP